MEWELTYTTMTLGTGSLMRERKMEQATITMVDITIVNQALMICFKKSNHDLVLFISVLEIFEFKSLKVILQIWIA